MKLVVLYEELAGYLLSSLLHFQKQTGAEVFLFKKEVNKEAPFQFETGTIKVFDRNSFTNQELSQKINSIKPSAILCGGWIHKPYLKVCENFQSKIPVILCFDNKWQNTLKQKIATLVSPFYYRKIFNRCFVAGEQQKVFAEKLGFNRVEKGFYTCDSEAFNEMYLAHFKDKHTDFPKRFIYTGRYVKHKGINELCEVFIDLYDSGHKDWELWCVGTGSEKPIAHKQIKHLGFVQPKDLKEVIKKTGVFVLPSFIEPWGVVLHEFAMAGFPLVCSSEVGASSEFLVEGRNGYSFNPSKGNELKNSLLKIMTHSDDQLVSMSKRSHEIAQSITLKTWTESLIGLIEN